MQKYILSITFFMAFSTIGFAQQNGKVTPKGKNAMDNRKIRSSIKLEKREHNPKKQKANLRTIELKKAEAEAMANNDGQISNVEWEIIEAYERKIEQLSSMIPR